MSAKQKRFIVLHVCDKDSWGYDENSLPLLLRLIDGSKPNVRRFTHLGVVSYYEYSRRAFERVERVLLMLEELKDSDKRFYSLGIGLAFGDLIADFDWMGRLEKGCIPIGEAANRAFTSVQDRQGYQEVLAELRKMFFRRVKPQSAS